MIVRDIQKTYAPARPALWTAAREIPRRLAASVMVYFFAMLLYITNGGAVNGARHSLPALLDIKIRQAGDRISVAHAALAGRIHVLKAITHRKTKRVVSRIFFLVQDRKQVIDVKPLFANQLLDILPAESL